jgi:hypothetical protein
LTLHLRRTTLGGMSLFTDKPKLFPQLMAERIHVTASGDNTLPPHARRIEPTTEALGYRQAALDAENAAREAAEAAQRRAPYLALMAIRAASEDDLDGLMNDGVKRHKVRQLVTGLCAQIAAVEGKDSVGPLSPDLTLAVAAYTTSTALSQV